MFCDRGRAGLRAYFRCVNLGWGLFWISGLLLVFDVFALVDVFMVVFLGYWIALVFGLHTPPRPSPLKEEGADCLEPG